MEYTYEQLKHMTVAQLREIAKGDENEVVQGYTQLNKEHLVAALSKALGIKHEHHDVVGSGQGVHQIAHPRAEAKT